jgi:hypothetical protein
MRQGNCPHAWHIFATKVFIQLRSRYAYRFCKYIVRQSSSFRFRVFHLEFTSELECESCVLWSAFHKLRTEPNF